MNIYLTLITALLIASSVCAFQKEEPSSTVKAKEFTKAEFKTAQKLGTATWRWTTNGVKSYSWSYGMPGILIFGEPSHTASIEATLTHKKGGPNGCQGIAVCVPEITDIRTGKKGIKFYKWKGSCIYARYSGSRMTLATRFFRKVFVRSEPLELKIGSEYKLRLDIDGGKNVHVFFNGKKVLDYKLEKKLSGRMALVAANGGFTYKDIKYRSNEQKPKTQSSENEVEAKSPKTE